MVFETSSDFSWFGVLCLLEITLFCMLAVPGGGDFDGLLEKWLKLDFRLYGKFLRNFYSGLKKDVIVGDPLKPDLKMPFCSPSSLSTHLWRKFIK